MNHYLLPVWNGNDLVIGKYGNLAIPKLLEKLVSIGGEKKYVIAKIFGGASIINTENKFSIGLQNIEIANSILKNLKIEIVSSSVGGNNGRNLKFLTNTGEVFIKQVSSNNSK